MAEVVRRDDLVRVFVEAEKPDASFRIGAESEKFGVRASTMEPLFYGGNFSVCRILEALCEDHGWTRSVEVEGGPVLGAKRGGASITLEPGAQLELSGDALPDLHLIAREMNQHLAEIAPASERLGVVWLGTGFHPTAQLKELPWVPKQRYPIMREYLPQKGKAALDMMQRTCTTQGNFDWRDERDGMAKLTVALKLAPLIQAWFANAPFKEGRVTGMLSNRGVVWQNMDPSRSGLIRPLWLSGNPGYEDYVEWALDAGMFLFRRGDEWIKNTGQTFRDFLEHGYQGHHATMTDWRTHLATLFPEVRLKNTLEVRSVDALPTSLSLAALAVWTGIFYDQRALEATSELVRSFSFDAIEAARSEFCQRALHVELLGRSAFDWARDVFDLAREGLARRDRRNSRGQDETVYLEPALEILDSRKVPAERALEVFERTGSLLAATQLGPAQME